MAEVEDSLESLLRRAESREREYDWKEAAVVYGQAMTLAGSDDRPSRGRIREARAWALFKHAFQARRSQDFRERLAAASSEYAGAKDELCPANGKPPPPEATRSDAMMAYIAHWLSKDNAEKKRLAFESWRLAKDAMDLFEGAGDGEGFARTLNSFSFAMSEAYCRSGDFDERERLVREALAYAERAAKMMEGSPDRREAAKTFFNVCHFTGIIAGTYTEHGAKKMQVAESAFGWWRKAFERSREAAEEAFAYVIIGGSIRPHETEKELPRIVEETLAIADASNDRLTTGLAVDWMGLRAVMSAHTAEDAETINDLLDKGLMYAVRAGEELSVISYVIPSQGPIWSAAPMPSYHMWKAIFEPDMAKKREHAQKALDLWTVNETAASECGCPEMVSGPIWDRIRILNQLALTEKDARQKRKLLEESMVRIDEFQGICDRLRRYELHRDYIKNWLADTEYGLSEVATGADERVDWIRKAIKHKKEDIEAYYAECAFLPTYTSLADQIIGDQLYLCGKWSMRLRELTGDDAELASAIRFFGESAEHFEKVGWPSRCAEGHWQIAQVRSSLEEHEAASGSFTRAAECYRSASQTIPRLNGFFLEYESYMKAWSEIERARHSHLRRDHKRAEERFENASRLLSSTKRWAYLASDYSAWAGLERAEVMSRSDSNEGAAEQFAEAAGLFDKSTADLQAALGETDGPDERGMIMDVLKASETRRAYCLARRKLEEAKTLDKRGEEGMSSEMYGAASKEFELIMQGLERDQDRKEMRLATTLAKACQAMTSAEAEASSGKYGEAAALFDEVRGLTPSEKEMLLMTGHCRFCRALGAGTQFADSGDAAFHAAAIKNLESAAKYYLKAGNDRAAEYANASRLLLDAYLYMGQASGEADQEKRATLYAVSEKILRASASSFKKAGHQAKEAEMGRLLERVGRDRELAASLNETFTAPQIASATSVLSTPVPTDERAAGLDKFEHADVQAMVIVPRKELKVGDPLDVEIELVNAGKGSAQLTKVENVIPMSFEVLEKPEKYRIEDTYIVMKGRRLDPLKTEEVALVLRPTAKGEFVLKPRVLYVDDDGSYKFREAEGCVVTVKELGISGWLRGPDRS